MTGILIYIGTFVAVIAVILICERRRRIARAAAMKRHPSTRGTGMAPTIAEELAETSFDGVGICNVRCDTCGNTYYAFPHNGDDYWAVYQVEETAILAALGWHRSLDHHEASA